MTSIGSDKAPRGPNIIFILADDLGWAELGCYGNTFNETPHLDRLARGGIRLTQAYAAAPVCSPYRAALLTGQYPARVGITDYLRPSDPPLSTNHITIAEMLGRAGYATGIIGKWHLTGYRHHGAKTETRPTAHGFDEERVCEIKGVGNGANSFPYVFRKQPISWLNVKEKALPGDEYLVDRMNVEAVQFIERHRDGPFFLYLSHYAVHTILNGKPQLVEKYRRKHSPGRSTRDRCYLCQDAGLEADPGNHWAQDHNPHLAAMLESIDDGVGMIMDTLERLLLTDSTLVIFTSDNGGETNVTTNAPLRAGKSSLYEGGIRVPLIVRWPRTIPPGKVSHTPTSNVDFYPTLLACADMDPDPQQTLDGVSILPILKDARAKLDRDALFWHYPLEKPHFLGGRSSGAIRRGDWKLIEFFDTHAIELYNLSLDAGEKKNLADKHPDKAAELAERLADWRRETVKITYHSPLTTKHLAALSDTRGIGEFARGTTPEKKRFCVEDTARALVAVLKMHALAPTDETARLARRYLDAIAGLRQDDGRLRFGYDQEGKPIPVPAKGDQLGRVLWGLGHASCHGTDQAMRIRAQTMFMRALPHLRTKARGPIEQSYAIQGLHLFLQVKPAVPGARQALIDCADHLLSGLPKDPADNWQWPEDMITYDSARFPLALLLAFETTGNARYRDAGLRVLRFLDESNFPREGTTLHVFGNHGWYRRGKQPAPFDQQPIDASSLVEATVAAWRITHDESWRLRARTAFSWFTGNNVNRVAVYHPESGGCRDGLVRDGANRNQGAESTVSYWIARCEIETLTTQPPR